jgi:hypothetical protein
MSAVLGFVAQHSIVASFTRVGGIGGETSPALPRQGVVLGRVSIGTTVDMLRSIARSVRMDCSVLILFVDLTMELVGIGARITSAAQKFATTSSVFSSTQTDRSCAVASIVAR